MKAWALVFLAWYIKGTPDAYWGMDELTIVVRDTVSRSKEEAFAKTHGQSDTRCSFGVIEPHWPIKEILLLRATEE